MQSRVSSFSHGALKALDALFSASRVAGAVERGAAPAVRDLERLGIDATAFATIHQV